MGCGGSTHDAGVSKRKHDRGIYKELAEAIQLCEIPSDRHRRIVENNRKEEFKHPKGQGEQSLLVIAIDSGRWEWFR